MANFNRRDQQLLSEAYSVQLLKESIPTMTLSQVSNNLDLLSESEEEYVCKVSEKILNEFFGGLKNVFGGAGKSASKGGAAVAQQGSKIGQGLKNAASSAVSAAKGVGKGALAAGKQIGSNIKDQYDTGVEAEKSQSFVGKAQQYVDALRSELEKAQQSGLISFAGPIEQMQLGEIVDELMVATQGRQNFANSAQRKGTFGGVGKAFQKGRQG
jgi:hypothetical protein